MSVLRILNPVTWKRKNLTDAERYTGKLIRIKWNTRRFITHWDFDALPDVIDLYGMEWTACSDVTISALQKITDGTFIIAGITPGNWRVQAQAPWGEEYRGVSDSTEMFIDVNEGATLTNIGKITLSTVNLIGRILMPDDTAAQWAPVNIETLDWSYFAHVNTDDDGYFRAGGLSATGSTRSSR